MNNYCRKILAVHKTYASICFMLPLDELHTVYTLCLFQMLMLKKMN